MFGKWQKYSYADKKKEYNKITRVLSALFLIFIVYAIFSAFILTTVSVENASMAPNLKRGDRLIVLRFGFWPQGRGEKAALPLADRGDIVIVSQKTRLNQKEGAFFSLARLVTRFCTIQRFDLGGERAGIALKRVIGIPGDELSMKAFVFRVKAAGTAYSLTEYELAGHPYDLAIKTVPDLWQDSFPFSSAAEPFRLGERQYFLVSDDRSSSSDSRTWGPVQARAIEGKAIFRYWPLSRFGRI